MRLRFGDCLLDTDLRQLIRNGHEMRLTPKAFHLLEVLAKRRPRVVSQADLRQLIWPDTTTGGTTIARLLCEVRAAIDDQDRPPRFIRTVHRFGYAFSGTATDEGVASTLKSSAYALQWGPRLVPLGPGENIIGRAPNAAVSISLDRVSRRHARIVVGEGRAVLEDLGSKHGTVVADRRVEGPVELKHGDQIAIGPVLLIFRDSTSEDPTL